MILPERSPKVKGRRQLIAGARWSYLVASLGLGAAAVISRQARFDPAARL
jgi:hypothetical protein